ncbi:response regulator SirA [bacterium]|nr:response regulator SirA [bacterium]
MAVENKLAKIKKRTGVLVPFEQARIGEAIFKAAQSNGGFKQDIISDSIYNEFKGKTDQEIANLLSDDVVMCLNANASSNSRDNPPDIETIQSMVVHVLRSRGFIDTADVYEVYRWGKTKVREGDIAEEQFARNGYPDATMKKIQAWNVAHNCETIQKLNSWVLSGRFHDLVRLCIEEYDRMLDEAAERFLNKGQVRLLIVAGPSSSGKTTTTNKLEQRLNKHGITFKTLNLDNYFLGLSEYPQDMFGDWDFETPHALRLDLINEHLKRLLAGETVKAPVYDFKRGTSIPEAMDVSIKPTDVLLLDSLHGLYPPMTDGLPEELKFKIFFEAMPMQMVGDGSSKVAIKWTDVRMLRRMLRDREHRNHNPAMTLGHWHFVRKAELRDMFPYIFTTDLIINGALAFELPVLKTCMANDFPDPQEFLKRGRLDAYTRGERVQRVLDSLVAQPDISTEIIPADCHLREFIGGLNIR